MVHIKNTMNQSHTLYTDEDEQKQPNAVSKEEEAALREAWNPADFDLTEQ